MSKKNPPSKAKPTVVQPSKTNLTQVENEQTKLRKEQATKFENYIHESGLAMGFQLIFAELISKKISPENYFSYVTVRLREIGRELESLKVKPEEKKEENDDEGEDNDNNEENEDD